MWRWIYDRLVATMRVVRSVDARCQPNTSHPTLTTAAAESPKSSIIPRLTAALVATADHASGTTRSHRGTASLAHTSKPSVKMVVGQGTPNVGAAG